MIDSLRCTCNCGTLKNLHCSMFMSKTLRRQWWAGVSIWMNNYRGTKFFFNGLTNIQTETEQRGIFIVPHLMWHVTFFPAKRCTDDVFSPESSRDKGDALMWVKYSRTGRWIIYKNFFTRTSRLIPSKRGKSIVGWREWRIFFQGEII